MICIRLTDGHIPDMNNNISLSLGICYKIELPLLIKKYKIK